MPPTRPQVSRHTFATAGPPRPGPTTPTGPLRRVPTRSLNDVALRSQAPLAQPRVMASPTVWVRLPASLRYPVRLEDMRMQVHVYRKM